jgi:hypothetical protein
MLYVEFTINIMPFNIKMKKNWATGQRTHAEAHIFLATLWQVSIHQQIMQTLVYEQLFKYVGYMGAEC